MKKRVPSTQKEKIIVTENEIPTPSMMEEVVNKKQDDNNENVTDTSIDTTEKGKVRLPDMTMKHIPFYIPRIRENENAQISPPPNMMEECVNKKHNNYNENETDSIMDTTKKGKINMLRYHIPKYDG